MLSLDLFDSRYEKTLHEGAVDDLEYRRIQDLNHRMDQLMKDFGQARTDAERAAIKRNYEELKNERASYFKVRTPEQQQPQAKGLLKGKDLITPQQRVAGATPQKPGVVGAVKDVAGGIKRWLQGRSDIGPTYESVNEQDTIDRFGPPQGSINPVGQPAAEQPASTPSLNGQMVVQILANAWDDKKPYVDIPYPSGNVTMSRAKIYDVLVTLKNMSDAKLNKIVGSIFSDRASFLLWSSQLKRLKPPVEKKPSAPPGQMKLFQETDSQKKNLKDQDDEVDTPQNLAVQRYLTRVRRKHPAATSDVEAMAKDEMEKQATTDQTIKDLKSVNARQDAALKKAMTLDRQQGDEIDDIEKQIDQLGQKLQLIKTAKPTEPGVSRSTATSQPQVAATVDLPKTSKSQSTDTPATTKAEPSVAQVSSPAQDQQLYNKVQDLEKRLQQKISSGASSEEINKLKQQVSDMQSAMNARKSSQRKTDTIDILSKIDTPATAGRTSKKSSDKSDNLELAKSVLSRFSQPEPVKEHGGGIGPRQHWQDLMPETVTNIRAGMAEIYRRLAPKIERHRDSFLAGQLYDELENYAELHGAEGEFKRMMNGARNRAHMEYDTNPGGFHNWFWFLPFEDQDLAEMDKSQKPPSRHGDYPLGAKGTTAKPTTPKKVVKSLTKDFEKAFAKEKGVTEGTDDIKKRMSKLEALALAANRAGDDAKCKMYQQKIQSLKQKLSQSMAEGSQNFNKVEPYYVCLAGKPVKKFDYYQDARRFHDNWKQKLYREGNKAKADKVTLMPVIDEGIKKSAAATALAACMAAGGTLSGCATNPSVGGAIGTVRDVGTAAKTASTMTRAGVQDELSQELRNFIRAQGGDPGSQNLSLLYKLQKRLQGQKDSQPINEVKDTEAVEQAIIKRIMVAHRGMLVEYGPEKIMTAASDVAYNVGDIGEMGDSDVSGWVKQVQQILGVDA
jgi:hypothetical protein